MSIVAEAKRVIQVEADALQAMAARIDSSFERAVDLILASKGRVVVSGMGKSGLIGQKIAGPLPAPRRGYPR
jgi:arabinose-5-phosphate isomerase